MLFLFGAPAEFSEKREGPPGSGFILRSKVMKESLAVLLLGISLSE